MTRETRRRFIQIAGSALAVGLAGCSSQSSNSEGSQTTKRPSTPTEQQSTTTEQTTTTTEQTTTEQSTTTTAEETGTTEDNSELHRHGTLYLEIDGERVDFGQENYFDGPLQFHFHDEDKPYEWHNERKEVTLGKALDLIPTISYTNYGSDHELTVEGTTYDTRETATIEFAQRDVEIDPTTYTLKDLDIIWVRVSTDGSESTTTSA